MIVAPCVRLLHRSFFGPTGPIFSTSLVWKDIWPSMRSPTCSRQSTTHCLLRSTWFGSGFRRRCPSLHHWLVHLCCEAAEESRWTNRISLCIRLLSLSESRQLFLSDWCGTKLQTKSIDEPDSSLQFSRYTRLFNRIASHLAGLARFPAEEILRFCETRLSSAGNGSSVSSKNLFTLLVRCTRISISGLTPWTFWPIWSISIPLSLLFSRLETQAASISIGRWSCASWVISSICSMPISITHVGDRISTSTTRTLSERTWLKSVYRNWCSGIKWRQPSERHCAKELPLMSRSLRISVACASTRWPWKEERGEKREEAECPSLLVLLSLSLVRVIPELIYHIYWSY